MGSALDSLAGTSDNGVYFFLKDLFLSEGVTEELKQAVLSKLCEYPVVLEGIQENLGLENDAEDCNPNVEGLLEYTDSRKLEKLSNAFKLVRANHPLEYKDFLTGFCGDKELLSHPEYTGTEGSLLAVFQTALSQCSPASAIGGFMDQWAPAAALLRSTNQPEVLLGTVYDAAPDTVMYSYVVAHGNQLDILVDALSAIGPLTPPEYIHQGITFLPYTPSINLYHEILKYQRIYLSSHIIYGSSRLGTKDYLPGQIYSMTDYTQAQPVKGTATLQSRRPWYSEEYQDNILYTHTEPWQATHNGIISAAERIGEKQYELSNHLGNVMATVSDNKYGVYGGTGNLSLESWRPAIRSAYDYYPFGMLMPGRYVSDTSRHCVTLSRPHWVWKWTVIGCKDYYAWVWPKLTLMGAATATPSENGILLNAQRLGEGMSFELNAQPNTENQFQLELNGLEMAKDAALQILEENGEEGWTVLAEVPIKDGEGLTVPFYPSLGKVKVVLLGPIRVLIRRVCVEGMAWVEENQLVTICDGDGDRYRWGFNGIEKVNEIADIGNHLDYGARGRDPRLGGGWWSPDPLTAKYPNLSPYHYAGNNPILFVDYEGRDFGVKINHETKTIVVVANVYTTSKTAYDQATKSLGAWNAKSATVDGYAVTFQVKVMEASKSPMSREDIIKANPSLVNKRGKVNEGKLATYQNKLLDNAAWSSASSDDIGNVYAGNKGYKSINVSGEKFDGGYTVNGKHISMNTHDEAGDMGTYPDLVTHEFGHLMGLDDAGGTYYSNDGVMKYKGTSLNPISDNDVKDILNFAKDALGGKTKETDAKVKLIEQTGKSDGANPIGVKNE